MKFRLGIENRLNTLVVVDNSFWQLVVEILGYHHATSAVELWSRSYKRSYMGTPSGDLKHHLICKCSRVLAETRNKVARAD